MAEGSYSGIFSACVLGNVSPLCTAAGDRFDRSRGRSIESIDSIDSIIFRSLAKFLKNRSRRDDRFRQKIVKIRAILAIFRPFEDFGDFRFDRFDIFFDSIDTEPNDRWGPPCRGWANVIAFLLRFLKRCLIRIFSEWLLHLGFAEAEADLLRLLCFCCLCLVVTR